MPLRREALGSLCAAVLERPETRADGRERSATRGVVPEGDRIRVIPKGRDINRLIEEHDVVAGLGPGRILLEALAMNRAALCLNVEGKGLYLDEQTVEGTEFYREDWGGPLAPLLDPTVVAANGNRRHVVVRAV